MRWIAGRISFSFLLSFLILTILRKWEKPKNHSSSDDGSSNWIVWDLAPISPPSPSCVPLYSQCSAAQAHIQLATVLCDEINQHQKPKSKERKEKKNASSQHIIMRRPLLVCHYRLTSTTMDHGYAVCVCSEWTSEHKRQPEKKYYFKWGKRILFLFFFLRSISFWFVSMATAITQNK